MSDLTTVLAQELNKKILKRGFLSSFSWEQLAPPRPGRLESTPKSKWWLLRRRIFIALWRRIETYGLGRDFLDYDGCYECGGGVSPTRKVSDDRWVHA